MTILKSSALALLLMLMMSIGDRADAMEFNPAADLDTTNITFLTNDRINYWGVTESQWDCMLDLGYHGTDDGTDDVIYAPYGTLSAVCPIDTSRA